MDYYTFPSVERLAGDDVEKILRDLGFGYRAGFIAQSAKQVLSKGGSKYLTDLRRCDYESAKAALMELQGVGAKVRNHDHLQVLATDIARCSIQKLILCK